MGNLKVSEVASGVARGAVSTNVYLVRSGLSWALVDAGWSGSEQTIQAAAESVFGPGARPASMLLTHLHPDHSGSIRRLAEYWGQAAYVHPDELPLASGCFAEYAMPLDRWVVAIIRLLPKKAQAKIAADANLTDVVHPLHLRSGLPGLPDWEAIHTPGHSPGHVSLYRSDGVLITGDAVLTVDLNSLIGVMRGRQGVFGPPRYATWDWAEGRSRLPSSPPSRRRCWPPVTASRKSPAPRRRWTRSPGGWVVPHDGARACSRVSTTAPESVTGLRPGLSASAEEACTVPGQSWDRPPRTWWCSRYLDGARE